MSRHRFAATMALAGALAAAASSAVAGPTLDTRSFVPLEEIEPGARCVGRTVFAGTEVSEFEIEILGVVEGTSPGGDLIIGRAVGEPLERTGILQGMSGSPIYLDGRLVGALSASWAFSKEPLAGITPIEEMLPALEAARRDAGDAGAGAAPVDWRELVPASERAASRAVRLAGIAGVESRPAGAGSVHRFEGAEMRPLAAPLVVSGSDDGFLGRLSRVFAGSAITPVRGSSDPGEGSVEVVPGAAVGVQLVRGDQTWTAIGTVTHREGDRIIAFGHPLFDAGAVEMPLVGGFVHALMPLQSVSFKYASGTDLVGTVVEDRSRVVAGTIGSSPSMMPLDVTIRGGVSGARSLSFEVVRSTPYAPVFAGLVLAQSIAEEAKASGPSSVGLRIRLATDDERLDYRDTFYTEDPAFRAAGELAGLTNLILDNGFEDRAIRELTVEIDLAEERREFVIERVETDRTFCEAGDEIPIRVTLRPWRGPLVRETVVLRLPDSTPPGIVTVVAAGASEFLEWELDRLGEGLRPRSYAQLLELVESSRPGSALVVQAFHERPGLSLAGRELSSVPGRAALVVATGSGAGSVDRAEFSVLAEEALITDRQVRGAKEIGLVVRED